MLRILRSIAGSALPAGIVLLLASAGAQSARSEVMNDYARAKVQGYEESTTDFGARSASANGHYKRDIPMMTPSSGGGSPHYYNASRTNVAGAKVSDDPSRWLEVRSSNDGPYVYGTDERVRADGNPGPSNSAGMASWVGDRLQIAAGGGQPSQGLPAFLRLNFRVLSGADEFSAIGGLLSVRVNELTGHLTYYNSSVAVDGTSHYLAPGETPLAFDDVDPYVPDRPKSFYFHYDLPIGTDGLSDPLTVSLTAKANEASGYGRTWVMGHKFFGTVPLSALALDSITLPDGSTPESRGYSLTFGSGLRSPNAVPEPASIVVWAAAGAAAFGLARRRRERSPA